MVKTVPQESQCRREVLATWAEPTHVAPRTVLLFTGEAKGAAFPTPQVTRKRTALAPRPETFPLLMSERRIEIKDGHRRGEIREHGVSIRSD